MRRREFIAGLGGAAAWPLAVRAQRPDQLRLIGVLMASAEHDPAKTANALGHTVPPNLLTIADEVIE